MFGLFKSKTERVVIHLERVMNLMETAAMMGELKTLHSLTRDQVQLLGWLNMNGSDDWDEERVNAYIISKGRVRSLTDPKMRALMEERVMAAEMRYGLVGA